MKKIRKPRRAWEILFFSLVFFGMALVFTLNKDHVPTLGAIKGKGISKSFFQEVSPENSKILSGLMLFSGVTVMVIFLKIGKN